MKGGSQTSTSRIDPASQTYVDEQRRRALGLADYANPAFAALSGDPAAVQRFMNPYGSTLDPYWDRIRERTLSDIGSRATLQGAYGGSRHGIAEGAALGEIGGRQAQQRYDEFARAMAQAGGLSQLGLSSLFGGLGPTGQIQRTPTQSSPLMGLLGAGLGIAGAFPGLFPASWMTPQPRT